MILPIVATVALAISFQGEADEDAAPQAARETIEVVVARGPNQGTERLRGSYANPEHQANAVRAPLGRRLTEIELDRENFDRWIFGTALSEAEQQSHLENALHLKIETAARVYKLTKAQQRKLQLAGRGDIKHFYDEVETKRREFEVSRKAFRAGYVALRRLNGLSDLYRDGPFVDDYSLFAKTLRKLDEGRLQAD